MTEGPGVLPDRDPTPPDHWRGPDEDDIDAEAAERDAHLAELARLDWWDSLSDAEREAKIQWAARNYD